MKPRYLFPWPAWAIALLTELKPVGSCSLLPLLPYWAIKPPYDDRLTFDRPTNSLLYAGDYTIHLWETLDQEPVQYGL